MNVHIKLIIVSFFLSVIIGTRASAQNFDKGIFSVLNLNYKGLENIKKLHDSGHNEEALSSLLVYYKDRKTVTDPTFTYKKPIISKELEKMVDDAMHHVFFSYAGFKPLNYGKDINWDYWPVHDDELRWQLHRLKWFIPMGKVYQVSGDEKYAKEWVLQYNDWIKKNPLLDKVDNDNMHYSWRPLEVSNRLAEQYSLFQYFSNSPAFTPQFFSVFLSNVYRHANFVHNNYSKAGNHLLFEAQRILFAGIFFPEFKDAPEWRREGIEILNREMKKQIYPDGFQYELDPGYHAAMIEIFLSAMRLAEVNGYNGAFPPVYKATIAKMIEAYYNILLPDFSVPMFSDEGYKNKADAMGKFKNWRASFPDDQVLQYFITGGLSGTAPQYKSRALKTSGFYTFRSDWGENATAMVLKAGPPASWHCQLDNGTFNIMFKGRNFFPDAGSYSYGGDEEIMKMRNWFRQTKVHNTLTLDDRNLDSADSKCLLWNTDRSTEFLMEENPSYKDLKHRRTVFFVDKKFFVIVDEAIGSAAGKVGLHYQLCEGPVKVINNQYTAITAFKDDNNMILKTFCNENQTMNKEEGWISYKAKEKFPREAFSFDVKKKPALPVRYITVILPIKDQGTAPPVDAHFDNISSEGKKLAISVKIGDQTYALGYEL